MATGRGARWTTAGNGIGLRGGPRACHPRGASFSPSAEAGSLLIASACRGGDRDLAAAIAASKATAEEEARRGQKTRGGDAEMEEAMRLSREEDARRRAALAAQNGASLFDEQRQSVLAQFFFCSLPC